MNGAGVLALTALLGGYAGGLTQSLAPAEKVEVSANASSGTGVSMAGAGGTTLTARSPTFVNLDAGLRLSNLRWLELSAGLQLELEGRVSVAVVPRLRGHIPLKLKRAKVWGTLGGPMFVHPFTLYGIMAGFGGGVLLHRHFGLYTELTATAFFAGSDLMDGSALGKIDLALGLQVLF